MARPGLLAMRLFSASRQGGPLDVAARNAGVPLLAPASGGGTPNPLIL